MPRGIVFIIVLLVIVVGGAILLAGRVKEQPTHTIEVNVATNAPAR